MLAAAGGVAVAFATHSAPAHRHAAAPAADLAARPTPSAPDGSNQDASNQDAGPYFATPQAAMRYLAAAWNRHDKVALWHVTTPDGRNALEPMRSEPTHLRLRSCTRNHGRDHTCVFDHDDPPPMHHRGHGTAT